MSDYYSSSAPKPPTEELPLFGETPPIRSKATDTRNAARRGVASRSTSIRQRVLAFLRDRGPRGATDEEIREALDLGESTARPRRRELVAKGDVFDSGDRRKSSKGYVMIVWKARATSSR